MSNPVILVAGRITEQQRSAIIAPPDEFSTAQGFAFRPASLALLLQKGDAIVGVLIGRTNWDWLYIEIISVATHLRGRGYGRQLMERAEEIARARHCTGVWVNTYSFQSPGFYQRLGCRIFGILPSYPGAERRIFLMKAL